MSERVVYSILDALRGRGPSDETTAIPIAQLLAWAKLSDAGKPAAGDFGRLAAEPYIQQAVKAGLERLARSELLGADAAAFEPDGSTPRLSDQELLAVVRIIESARQSELLDYAVAVNALYEWSARETYLPREVAELCVELAGVRPGDSIYCPFDGSTLLAVYGNKVSHEVYAELWRTAHWPHLFNILAGLSIKVRQGDPIRQPSWIRGGELMKFDRVLVNPPFGVRYTESQIVDLFNRFPEQTPLYGEVLHIRHALAQMRRSAVVLVPDGVLFRTAAGERDLKEELVERGLLRAVIALPGMLLRMTNIPFSLLVLDGESPRDSVLLIDASTDEFFEKTSGQGAAKRRLRNANLILNIVRAGGDGDHSRLLSKADLAANEYNLLAARYVMRPERRALARLLENRHTVELGKLAQLIRPQSLGGGNANGAEELYEAAVSDIGEDGFVRLPSKKISVPEKKMAAARRHPADRAGVSW